MSISESVAPQLPYLRRFARVLSGSQESGDAYVVAMLEAIAAEPSMFPVDLEPRVATYQCFLDVWNSVRLNHTRAEQPTSERLAAADRKLEAITPRARQAFLLMAVEEFSTSDAAKILKTDEVEVKALVDQAASEIAEQVATNVLIIEDEPMIALDLADLVSGLGHAVSDTARTHKEAVAAFRQHQPGLVLADIQLADGSSGLEAVNEILESFDVPVIFITAYPERLLTGSRPEPTFLINKPFRTETVQAVISQALFFDYKARLPDAKAASA
ncbi:Phyllosphere-induced regulator PhyR [Hyphomicrobium sp. 1Nfss2.1]|uniref:response regulator n=1 Tax=Hyphomicrobium sp. 1Nfss2.1 TaxID=3413936 RepID=UPI003C7E09AD